MEKPRLLTEYKIIKRISEGNFGTVYKVCSVKSRLNRPKKDICFERDNTHKKEPRTHRKRG